MNNKVKFLRGTSDEYTVAEKDSDTIYFTTDDGKLYIGNKEVSGGGSGGMTVDTLLDITVSKGDTSGENYSSCSPANDSIITLDGNMLDYKFVYRVADYNGGIILAGSTQNRFPCIFDPDDLTHKSYGQYEANLIDVANSVKVYYSSMNQVKIEFSSNSSVFTSRIRLLGIK